MKYYKLYYKCLKLRIKIQSRIIKNSNKCTVKKGRNIANSPRAQKGLKPGLVDRTRSPRGGPSRKIIVLATQYVFHFYRCVNDTFVSRNSWAIRY